MRIVLVPGKQKLLINLAKTKFTWEELARKLNFCSGYIRNSLGKEITYFSEDKYKQLCNLINVNFDNFIINKLPENWGKIRGASLSSGSIKKLIEPSESKDLAELFGIILGDGHIDKIIRGKKTRCYCITIAGDSRDDKDYLENYVNTLFEILFKEKGKISYSKFSNSLFLKIYGKRLVEFFIKRGLENGNKKINRQSIPDWIFSNKEYLKNCLRGLIDTDGSIHYISKSNKNIRISYTSYIPALLNKVRLSFILLGFNPSKIISGKQIFLSKKEDIFRYMKIIGFGNQKHLKRFKKLKRCAPVV